jgi:hypothetical protein
MPPCRRSSAQRRGHGESTLPPCCQSMPACTLSAAQKPAARQAAEKCRGRFRRPRWQKASSVIQTVEPNASLLGSSGRAGAGAGAAAAGGGVRARGRAKPAGPRGRTHLGLEQTTRRGWRPVCRAQRRWQRPWCRPRWSAARRAPRPSPTRQTRSTATRAAGRSSPSACASQTSSLPAREVAPAGNAQ